MTEQTQTYRLPGDAERGESFGSRTPELVEAQAAAQSSEAMRGKLREVRAADPEAVINLEEEDSTGAFWRQQENERRLLEQRAYQARLSHEEKLAQAIDNIPQSEYLVFAIDDMTRAGALITNYRAYKAAA